MAFQEVVIVPAYRRPELLYCCLKRIRAVEPDIPVFVFPDRGTADDHDVQEVIGEFKGITTHFVPKHSFHGNSYNAGEALRFAYNSGFELVHYIEEDAMAKPDLFEWTRRQHDLFEDIFCSAGWVFNRCAPIDSGDYFVPWIYIPQFTIRRSKLALLVKYLSPDYYADMQKFIAAEFLGCSLDNEAPFIAHYELDGLIQRVIDKDKSQVVWPSVTKVEHLGFASYNRGGYTQYERFFEDTSTSTKT